MSRASPIHNRLRSAALPALAIIAMGFFGYYAVLGPNGIVAYKEYQRQLAQRNAEYAQLKKHRAQLQNRVNLLDAKRGVDPDLADELTRKQLNVVRPDEVIIPLDK